MQNERRATTVAVAVPSERRVVERREKVNRRRQIDPTTCERDYTDAEVEFMHALDQYKRTSGRMFPTCSEVLEVLRGLGYEKTAGLARRCQLPRRPRSEGAARSRGRHAVSLRIRLANLAVLTGVWIRDRVENVAAWRRGLCVTRLTLNFAKLARPWPVVGRLVEPAHA